MFYQRPSLKIQACVTIVEKTYELSVEISNTPLRNCFQFGPNYADPLLDIYRVFQSGFFCYNFGDQVVRGHPKQKKAIIKVSSCSFGKGAKEKLSISGSLDRDWEKHQEYHR